MITNIYESRYEHIELFGQPALFSDERIARDCVPEGWFCCDIRGNDGDPWEPATAEPRVTVNHAGTVLSPTPIDLGSENCRELGDEPKNGLAFLGEEISVLPRVELYSVKDFMGDERPGLAIVLDEMGGISQKMEQFAVLTVSFGEYIGIKNAVYIDVNNCPFAHELLEAGVAEDTGVTKSSGFCEYPLWVFNEDFLRAHSNGAYEKYEQAYEAYMRAAEPGEDEDEDLGMSL